MHIRTGRRQCKASVVHTAETLIWFNRIVVAFAIIPVARSCSCFGNMVCAKGRLKLSTIVANGRLKFMAQLANGHGGLKLRTIVANGRLKFMAQLANGLGGLKLRTIVAKAKLKFRTNKAKRGLKFLAQMAKPLDLGTVARRMVLMLRSQQ